MRFQFALIAVIVLAASLVIADDNLDEAKAIQKIELLGGKIERDETLAGRPVTGVEFQGTKRFNEKYLHLLKAFASLKSLNLSSIKITDDGMKTIGELTTVTTLYLGGRKITDEGLTELRTLKNLSELILCETSVTSAGHLVLRESLPMLRILNEADAIKRIAMLGGMIEQDGKMPGRRVVGISFNGRNEFNDSDLQLLKAFTNLTKMNLSGCKQITDVGVKEFINLTELDLSFCTQITDAGVEEIIRRRNLTNLKLSKTGITDIGLIELKELKNLTDLHLSDTAITDNVLNELSDLKNLKRLFLAKTKITDFGVKHLRGQTNLTTLDLSLTQITDIGLNELNELKNLKTLFVGETQVTDEGVTGLQKALPQLNIFR